MSKLIYKEETFAIRGACFNVYNQMGSGFLEAVYQESLDIELAEQMIPYDAQKELEVYYFDKKLKQKYIPDLICYGNIIVEIKAVKELLPQHTAQLFNYLMITGYKLGLLVNFGSYPKITIERIVAG